MLRLAIAGFMHESNTFNPQPADRAAFTAQTLSFGSDWVAEWRPAHHEIAGFLQAADELGFEPVPLLLAWAVPAGPVSATVYEEVVGELLTRVKSARAEGLLLALHGAMVTEHLLDPDGETVARLRRELGPDFPIVVSLDLHGNLSAQLIENCQAAVAYRTNPHVDQRECGLRAARLLVKHLRGEVRLIQALAKPSNLINIMVQNTSLDPLRSFMEQARAREAEQGVLAVSLLPGFAYSDVPQVGPTVVVVTDNQPELAQREADQLADSLWQARESLLARLPDAESAVRQALQSDKTPVVLVDTGDNVGGGSSADTTVLLHELLKQQATAAVCCLYDPESVQACVQAGVGGLVHLHVGGKGDPAHGTPVPFTGRVRVLHDGTYVEPQVRHGGRRVNHMGLTALVEGPGGLLLVLNSLRHPPFSLGQLTCLGIQPSLQRILVVKAAIAYRAAYGPIAGTILEVDTPGLTAINPHRFTYRHARRPLYPL